MKQILAIIVMLTFSLSISADVVFKKTTDGTAFEITNPKDGYATNLASSVSKNPSDFLGKRNDLTPKVFFNFASKFKNSGATILGGCCETRPDHIREIYKLK